MDLVDKPHDLPVGIIERARHVVERLTGRVPIYDTAL
jgi:hypothetical protein